MDKTDKQFVAPPWRMKAVQRDCAERSVVWKHASGFISHW